VLYFFCCANEIYPEIKSDAPKIESGIAETKSVACESMMDTIAKISMIINPKIITEP